MTRILTYNVHRCVGTDRRLDVGRIADVIAAQQPDIVALQEVDVGRSRTGGVDQAHALARRLEMVFHFNAALRVEEELYGDAILTSLPHRLIKAGHPSGDDFDLIAEIVPWSHCGKHDLPVFHNAGTQTLRTEEQSIDRK